MPGPLLTATIGASARRGPAAGPLFIAGHGILELALLCALLYGLGPFLTATPVFIGISLCGAGIMLFMAIDMLRNLPKLTLHTEKEDPKKGSLIGAGILLSISNPYWTIWWGTIGLSLLVRAQKTGTAGGRILFQRPYTGGSCLVQFDFGCSMERQGSSYRQALPHSYRCLRNNPGVFRSLLSCIRTESDYTRRRCMKLSAIVSALLIMLSLSLTTLYISAEEADYSSESVVIYRYAESTGYGRTDNRKDQISIPFSRFAETSTRAVEETAETALLIQKGIVDFIDYLAASSEESTETRYDLSAEKLAPLTYRIRHRGIGFEGVFAFNMPSDILMREIAGLYENVYWQETVETEYAGNYTITVIEAEDAVAPYGLTDFKDAMVSATLIADKHQPLWGIHDGAGLLDGLGYLLVERQNRAVQGAGNYRPVSSNQHVMEEIVLRIRQSGENLAQEIHTEVNSLVQYEEDGTFLLPEELLEKQEGDNLEFALTYYDLAVRAGCETKLLAPSR